ncbi:uncharacterized protein [Typha latifolia]|uniref:uncharacterized protein isoform X1 n=1 Tax=Typha latifolia TaxID=4733 RepID=UPI003C2C5E28
MASLVLLFLAVLLLPPLAASITDPSEVEALRLILDQWGIQYWDLNSDPCTVKWPDASLRINCSCPSSQDGICHVISVDASGQNIVGKIPMELFNLSELVYLDVSKNMLSGQLPKEIGRLSNLTYLKFSTNNLSGPLPPELGNLTRLSFLSLSSNRFSGSLPKQLGNLTSLQHLYFDSNEISGRIPNELKHLKNLTTLWAFDNDINEELPPFIGNFTELRDLEIYGTLLSGPIPQSFSALTKLETLRLGDLKLSGSSLSFLKNLKNISILSLRNSNITGELPDFLGEFSNLTYLDLSFNMLSGKIPTSFNNFTSLRHLYLGTNNLTGVLPSGIITPHLVALDVSFNSISGGLPNNFLRQGFSMNYIGTLIDTSTISDSRTLDVLHCLHENSSCTPKDSTFVNSSFAVKCGGNEQMSSGIYFYDDSNNLRAAEFHVNREHQWVVSNVGSYLLDPVNSIVTTSAEINGTFETELYKSARRSPSSLRYYAVGLPNGTYKVDLYFAEIVIDDSKSWKSLGRRFFDIYIQGDIVRQDFNIIDEAIGSNRAVVKTFEANVTNGVIDIHFFWAGRGTCCIPENGNYGPLVSALHVYQDSIVIPTPTQSSKKERTGVLVGIAALCIAGVAIFSSIAYLWWKWLAIAGIQIHNDMPKRS